MHFRTKCIIQQRQHIKECDSKLKTINTIIEINDWNANRKPFLATN